MAVQVRIELNSPGMRELVTSDWAQQQVEAKAEEVAQRARGRGLRVEGEPGDVPLPIAVLPARSGARARAHVIIDHPSGVAVESKHRLLGGSL